MANAQDALANVYASSLFELAEQAGGRAKIEEVSSELEQVLELSRSDRMFREFFHSPIIDVNARQEALRSMFHGRVTDLTLRFMLVLNRKGRLSAIENIAAAYDHLMQDSFGRVEVDVFTAGPLGDEARSEIQRMVQSALGKEPVLHAYTDPKMIGGIKLRVGDRLIDGSVASKLRRLKDDLLNEGGAVVRSRFEELIETEDK